MSSTFLIPVKPKAQTFKVTLAGATYQMTLYWSSINNAWILDIADANGNPMVSGIPVVAGVDLLGPYGYLNFGGILVAVTAGGITQIPTFENLGSASNLYFITP